MANKLKLEWRPILSHTSSAKNLPNLSQDSISEDFINSTFSIATEHLRTNVCSYVWEKYKKRESWKVSTWLKRVNYQEILKLGTEEDIGNLPEGTVKNKKRPINWSL